jgi:fructokinase
MVYTLGEILLDVILKANGETHAVPGGSMLNASVSMAREGIKVSIISEIGEDRTGRFILDFLKTNGIETEAIHTYHHSQTSLALAFLDADGKPEYSFYKTYPENRKLLTSIPFKPNDIFVYASFYSVDPALRTDVLKLIRKAKANGATLFYDPNMRQKSHLKNLNIFQSVQENISMADCIKGSNEDFSNLFGTHQESFWLQQLRELNPHAPVIITYGDQGSKCFTGKFVLEQPAEKVKVASTVGAGDAFTAGMISQFLSLNKKLEELTGQDWKMILQKATSLSSKVCAVHENFVPLV